MYGIQSFVLKNTIRNFQKKSGGTETVWDTPVFPSFLPLGATAQGEL
jgi:hypothetical protein